MSDGKATGGRTTAGKARIDGRCRVTAIGARTTAATVTVGRTDRGLGGDAVEVVLVAVLDQHLDEIAGFQMAGIAKVDFAVDFGRVGL